MNYDLGTVLTSWTGQFRQGREGGLEGGALKQNLSPVLFSSSAWAVGWVYEQGS